MEAKQIGKYLVKQVIRGLVYSGVRNVVDSALKGVPRPTGKINGIIFNVGVTAVSMAISSVAVDEVIEMFTTDEKILDNPAPKEEVTNGEDTGSTV